MLMKEINFESMFYECKTLSTDMNILPEFENKCKKRK